jgi:hypothetical protein
MTEMTYYKKLGVDPQTREYGKLVGVYRMAKQPPLNPERWEGTGWKDHPPLYDALGFVADDDYHQISEEEARKLMDAMRTAQENAAQGEKRFVTLDNGSVVFVEPAGDGDASERGHIASMVDINREAQAKQKLAAAQNAAERLLTMPSVQYSAALEMRRAWPDASDEERAELARRWPGFSVSVTEDLDAPVYSDTEADTPEGIQEAKNADEVKWLVVDKLTADGITQEDAESLWEDAYNEYLLIEVVGIPEDSEIKSLEQDGEKRFVTLDDGQVVFIEGPGQGAGRVQRMLEYTPTNQDELAHFLGPIQARRLLESPSDRTITHRVQAMDGSWVYVNTPSPGRVLMIPEIDLVPGNEQASNHIASDLFNSIFLKERGGSGVQPVETTMRPGNSQDLLRPGIEQGMRIMSDAKNLPDGAAFAFKAADGSDWWMQWTTNAFQDREGEIFTTDSLKKYVARHQDEDVKGEFWYRHVPGTKFADVTWQAMVGRFLVQAGPFDDTPTGRAFKQFFRDHPNGHEDIAPHGWGTSHGYVYNGEDRKDGVYEWLEIKESTVLPSHVASNPWSPAPSIILRSNKMNAKEERDLLAIGGPQLVELVKRQGQDRTKILEGAVSFKSLPDAIDRLNALAEIAEGEMQDELQNVIAMLEVEAEGGEEEEVPEEEMPEEEMPEEEMPEIPEELKETGKDTEASEPPITREEIVEAMKLLGDDLREEITAEVTRGVKESLGAMLTPMEKQVAEMAKQDGERIAEKATQTPAASLGEMLRSVRQSAKATVEDGDPLLDRKPQENTEMANPTMGMPSFIGGLINQADQRKR